MKGQMFVLFGLLVAILLIYIGSIMQVDYSSHRLLLSDNFLNLKNGIVDKIDSELLDYKEPVFELNDFLNLSGHLFESKGIEQRVVYCYVFNGTNFTISNFMGDIIENTTVNFNGNIIHVDKIENGNSFSHTFSKTNSYYLEVIYYFNNTENTISFSGNSGKSSADITFYYLLYLGNEKEWYKDENIIRRMVW